MRRIDLDLVSDPMPYFTLDGITIQHAGELLFETRATEAQRPLCATTYRRCLEVVAFAIVCVERIAVNGSLPEVGPGRERPGITLVEALGDLVQSVRPSGPTRDELLAEDDFRINVAEDLQALDAALERGGRFWSEFALREATINLGSDPSIAEPELAPERYQFGRDSRYSRDDRLFSVIPPRFLQRFIDTISSQRLAGDAHPRALEEFGRRVALTHVANEWQLRRNVARQLGASASRLPHVTRALIRAAAGETGHWRARLHRLVVPHILARALRPGTTRDHVLANLLDIRSGFGPFRKKLEDADNELRLGRGKGALEKVLKEIEHATSTVRQVQLGFDVKTELEIATPTYGGISAKVKVPLGLSATDTYWLTTLGVSGDEGDYYTRLVSVFPELVNG